MTGGVSGELFFVLAHSAHATADPQLLDQGPSAAVEGAEPRSSDTPSSSGDVTARVATALRSVSIASGSSLVSDETLSLKVLDFLRTASTLPSQPKPTIVSLARAMLSRQFAPARARPSQPQSTIIRRARPSQPKPTIISLVRVMLSRQLAQAKTRQAAAAVDLDELHSTYLQWDELSIQDVERLADALYQQILYLSVEEATQAPTMEEFLQALTQMARVQQQDQAWLVQFPNSSEFLLRAYDPWIQGERLGQSALSVYSEVKICLSGGRCTLPYLLALLQVMSKYPEGMTQFKFDRRSGRNMLLGDMNSRRDAVVLYLSPEAAENREFLSELMQAIREQDVLHRQGPLGRDWAWILPYIQHEGVEFTSGINAYEEASYTCAAARLLAGFLVRRLHPGSVPAPEEWLTYLTDQEEALHRSPPEGVPGWVPEWGDMPLHRQRSMIQLFLLVAKRELAGTDLSWQEMRAFAAQEEVDPPSSATSEYGSSMALNAVAVVTPASVARSAMVAAQVSAQRLGESVEEGVSASTALLAQAIQPTTSEDQQRTSADHSLQELLVYFHQATDLPENNRWSAIYTKLLWISVERAGLTEQEFITFLQDRLGKPAFENADRMQWRLEERILWVRRPHANRNWVSMQIPYRTHEDLISQQGELVKIYLDASFCNLESLQRLAQVVIEYGGEGIELKFDPNSGTQGCKAGNARRDAIVLYLPQIVAHDQAFMGALFGTLRELTTAQQLSDPSRGEWACFLPRVQHRGVTFISAINVPKSRQDDPSPPSYAEVLSQLLAAFFRGVSPQEKPPLFEDWLNFLHSLKEGQPLEEAQLDEWNAVPLAFRLHMIRLFLLVAEKGRGGEAFSWEEMLAFTQVEAPSE